MDSLKKILPMTLVAAGGATVLVALVGAALSVKNPLALIVLLVAGIGLGALLAGLGVLLQQVSILATAVPPMRQDVRASAEATLEMGRQIAKAAAE